MDEADDVIGVAGDWLLSCVTLNHVTFGVEMIDFSLADDRMGTRRRRSCQRGHITDCEVKCKHWCSRWEGVYLYRSGGGVDLCGVCNSVECQQEKTNITEMEFSSSFNTKGLFKS